MTVITDSMTLKMCQALGRPDLADDPRFATDQGRIDHSDAVYAEIGAIFATETTAVWIQRLGDAGVPVAPVHSVPELMAFPQLDHRGVLMTLPAPPGMQGEITVPGAAFHASNGDPSGDTAAPLLGQHTDEVLGELGYDAATIASLRQDGVV
jgi:formyl-CoA transferase